MKPYVGFKTESEIRSGMDIEKAFNDIAEDIRNEKYDDACKKTVELSSSVDDINVKLKCASLLKVTEDEDECQDIVDSVLDSVTEDNVLRFDIGLSVRALGRAEDAYELMKDYRDDRPKVPEIARTLMMIGESEDALELMTERGCDTVGESILLCDILCSVGEYTKALSEAESLVKEDETYDTLRNLASVLLRKGDVKGAVKVAKEHTDKKNADSLALQAYVMYMTGKIPAAANYANRALHIDYSNITALEIMAMCLIEKGETKKAKLFAGVINNTDPLNPAAMRILDACRITSSTGKASS